MSTTSAPIVDTWDRPGRERLQTEEDEALLSGWHEVIRWFLSFILSTPKNALFLRKLLKENPDAISTMDLYLQYEPQVFFVAVTGAVYILGGLFGSMIYLHLRRRKRCGGDRTQDINENMRCVLQVYTAVYIVVLAGILLGALLMIASLFELGLSVGSRAPMFESYLQEVEYYVRNASMHQDGNNRDRVAILERLSTGLVKDFEDGFASCALRIMNGATTGCSLTNVRVARALQVRMKQTLARQDTKAPEYMARFMAQRVATVYNDTISQSVELAGQIIVLARDFSNMLVPDARKTANGFGGLPKAIEAADGLHVLKTLRSQSTSYVAAIIASFAVLFVMYAGSFIMGMFYYNEGIEPTKRSTSSNYAGLAMLLAVVLSFPVCSLLMMVTVAVMLVALTLTNYVCRPFESIVYDTAEISQISLLDDTMRVIWPRKDRGKWYGQFLAGTTLSTCNGGHLLDVIQGDYKDSVETLQKLTDEVRHLLLSLTVDPRLIFTFTEHFILELLKDLTAFHSSGNKNAFWTALGFCLWMVTILGSVSHFLSKYFLRMVNWTYDGSEVESFSSSSSSSTSPSGATPDEAGAAPATGAGGSGAAHHGPEAPGKQAHPPASESSELVDDKKALPKWLTKSRRKSQVGVGGMGGTLQRMHLEDERDEGAAHTTSTDKLQGKK